MEGCILSKFFVSYDEDVDYLIVLGSQVKEDGPGPALKNRLDKAYEYLVAHPSSKCIVSGGQLYKEPYSEAFGMQKYLVELGIDEGRILLEDNSFDTLENIQNSMKLFDPENDSIGLISSNFHMFRATRIAKKAGIKNVHPIAAHDSLLYLPSNLFREFFGVMKGFMKGYI